MSKGSAKSKGYRNYKKEKPFLTKKEIYALIVIVAVIIIGAIALFCYDDGALKVKDGAIVESGDNWVIVNNSKSSSNRYYKLGEMGEIEGFTRESNPSTADNNLNNIRFYPVAEDSPVDYISIGGSISTVDNLSQLIVESISASEEYVFTTEMTAEEINGMNCKYYAYSYETFIPTTQEEYDAQMMSEEKMPPNTFGQSASAYVDAGKKGIITIHVFNETESAEDFVADTELMPYLYQAIEAITLG